jgi:dihydrofolate synthase/folylpolyglutamate synthase
MVSTDKWLEIYNDLENMIDKHNLTFFEISALIAFELFRREKCSWVVLETGMGGRFDATNICLTQASVISKIGIDHVEYLGNTIEEITTEKLGIVKNGVPLIISGANEEKIIRQAQKYCMEKNTNIVISNLSRIKNVANSENPPEICLDLKDIYKLTMNGEFQKNNFILAITTLEILGFGKNKNIYESVAKTRIAARIQKVEFQNKTLIFDAAHNPQAMENFCNWLKNEKLKTPINVILGMMRDKDIKETVKHLIPAADSIFCFTPMTKRAEPADYLAQTLRNLKAKNIFVCKSANDALQKSLEQGGTTLISGSFYTISEIMEAANIKIL